MPLPRIDAIFRRTNLLRVNKRYSISEAGIHRQKRVIFPIIVHEIG